jgi:hypothetical protein
MNYHMVAECFASDNEEARVLLGSIKGGKII